jgi:hypothetical protein
MATGITESIGLQGIGNIPMPEREKVDLSPINSMLAREKAKKEKAATTVKDYASKFTTFSDPVLPGDEEKRREMFNSLLTDIYKKTTEDPSYNPSADPEYTRKQQEVFVEYQKMKDDYKRFQTDAQIYQVNKGKLLPGDVNPDKLLSTDPDVFEAERQKFRKGGSLFKQDFRVTNPWTSAIGTSLKIENADTWSIYTDENGVTTRTKVKGFDPNKPGAQEMAFEQISNWLSSGDPKAIAALQDAEVRISQNNPNFDSSTAEGKKQIEAMAADMVYNQYLRSDKVATGGGTTRSKTFARDGFGSTVQTSDGIYSFVEEPFVNPIEAANIREKLIPEKKKFEAAANSALEGKLTDPEGKLSPEDFSKAFVEEFGITPENVSSVSNSAAKELIEKRVSELPKNVLVIGFEPDKNKASEETYVRPNGTPIKGTEKEVYRDTEGNITGLLISTKNGDVAVGIEGNGATIAKRMPSIKKAAKEAGVDLKLPASTVATTRKAENVGAAKIEDAGTKKETFSDYLGRFEAKVGRKATKAEVDYYKKKFNSR